MSSDFKGLTAVVTGAGSGIGLEISKLLIAQGAAKVYGLDLAEGEMTGVASFIACDIADDAAVERAFAQIAKETSVIDVLVNNAAIGGIGTIEDTKTEEWMKIFNINVFGTSRVSAAAMPLLRKSKSASITNICSIAATAGIVKRAAYSASKGAILALTKAMAADYVKENIRVNCVNPATADTPWVNRLLQQAADPVAEKAALEARQPMGRLVYPSEIARAVCYLASPLQASTTGTALEVDGGMQSLRLPK